MQMLASPGEMLRYILYTEGTGLYRLVKFKKEHVKDGAFKIKYAIVKVLDDKYVVVQFLSALWTPPMGNQTLLEQAWKKLKSSSQLYVYHVDVDDDYIVVQAWKN